MFGYLVTILVSIFLTAVVVQESEAVCCSSGASLRWCVDCTRRTPYCGKGPCNVFGCACEGGCRQSCGPKLLDPVNAGIVIYYNTCRCNNKRSMTDEAVVDAYREDQVFEP
ncbi:uncharacterized protein LOC106171350 [Lingula anatina]|uniref:Uncharacterized protein LOC106171350 n=1 Tax=Lingula anatina TaxID=7574 RepID=A0A1S3J9P2_LINAN|nr:uncharacterized protein LOC106171350 [Lingula anatina]XP_013407115.1 uncharacterized protein LOC106171350 [Lingula anatina]|eukprot:XP_013407114.1 uncharacterized protein LOC106171350 [Lingula anatina]